MRPRPTLIKFTSLAICAVLFGQSSAQAADYVSQCASDVPFEGKFIQDQGSYFVYPGPGGSEQDADTINACIQRLVARYGAGDRNSDRQALYYRQGANGQVVQVSGNPYVKKAYSKKSAGRSSYGCTTNAPLLYKGTLYCLKH